MVLFLVEWKKIGWSEKNLGRVVLFLVEWEKSGVSKKKLVLLFSGWKCLLRGTARESYDSPTGSLGNWWFEMEQNGDWWTSVS